MGWFSRHPAGLIYCGFCLMAIAGLACTQPEPAFTAGPQPQAIPTGPPNVAPVEAPDPIATSPTPTASPTLAAPVSTATLAPTATLTLTAIPTPTAIPSPLPAPENTLEISGNPTPAPTPGVEVPIIDAHSQVDHTVGLRQVIQLMDQAGVRTTILSARGRVTPEDLVSFASGFPGRIIPAVRSKGKPYEHNEREYYRLLQGQVGMEGFGAIGEVLIYHAQKGVKAPEIVAYSRDERVQAALREALGKGWPFVAHIEFAAAGDQRDVFMAQLKEMLAQHPDHPFVLIHMGQLDHFAVRNLIDSNDNIYFITAHTNPLTVTRQPWINMFDGNLLSPDWRQLMVDHPDRFILGFDNVWPEHWGQYYLDQVTLWRKAMKGFPPDVAHAFAHGNAERLWRLAPVNSALERQR